MREIRICDDTMKRASATGQLALTFKEKLELAKLLDSLNVSVIGVEGLEKPKADSLRIKSIASLAKDCVLAVPVKIDGSDVDDVWAALSEAVHPRLQVQVATSPARMEYSYKLKAQAMMEAVTRVVGACAAKTTNVEFIAEDATRADFDFLCGIIEAAIEAGATTVTVCDDAGIMLPDEFTSFLSKLFEAVSKLGNVSLGISCSNELFMAISTSMAGIAEGATEVKTTSYPLDITELPKLAKALSSKGESYGVTSELNITAMNRTVTQIKRICERGASKTSLFGSSVGEDAHDIALTGQDDMQAVSEAVAKLGYDLTEDDMALVFEEFQRIASRKESVGGRELDAIVASAALQVPATYKLVSYTINSGNKIKATAAIQMDVSGHLVQKVALGDGPIDAAFAALDDIIGKVYELDDWQMQSVTEGQEAMGECVIKLISDGKVYSGRGISTDIVGSSIRAYVNALNKIVYEEGN